MVQLPMEVGQVAFFLVMFHAEEMNNFYLTALTNISVHITLAVTLGTLE